MMGKKNGTLAKLYEPLEIFEMEECGFEIKYNDGDEQIVQLYKEPKEDIIIMDN